MQRSRLTQAPRVRCGALLVVLTFGLPVRAAEPVPPGQEPLTRARSAWDQGDYDVAEQAFREAIEKGGLAPPDVLDAFVRLGSSRAILGKKEAALAAFKAAAVIDGRFTIPPEAGRKASQLAEKARRAEARIGSISLHVDVPGSLGPGESAQVDAILDPAHLMVASKVAVLARDPMTGKSYQSSEESAPSVHFKLPTTLALPDATLVIRVDALDPHDNRLASAEQKLHVQGAAKPAPIAVAVNESAQQPKKGGGGFWATPWPYLLGGAALAAGGAAVYFATRPSSDVNVDAVHVQLTH